MFECANGSAAMYAMEGQGWQGAHAQARALRVQRVQLRARALPHLQRRDALRQRRQRGVLLRQQHLAVVALVLGPNCTKTY